MESRGKYTALTLSFSEAAQDFVDDGRNSTPIRSDRQMSHTGIEWCPLIHQFRHARSHISNTAQQRPILPSSNARYLLSDRGLEIDHRATLAQIGPILSRKHRAATGRQYNSVGCGQLGDDFPLTLTEPDLALGVEDARDIDSGPAFDLRIGIDKGHMETTRERFAHGRLTRPHRPYEK
jgi:hypothetical protein